MSKSLDYTMKYLKDVFNKDTTEEKLASVYMDWILHGKREQVKDTVCGIIRSIVDFDADGDFNYLNSWSGKLDSPFSEDLLEEQMIFVSKQQLTEHLHVPTDDGVTPFGGNPQNGDTIHVTFGNYIVNVKDQTDTSCYMNVALPMRYELIKGHV